MKHRERLEACLAKSKIDRPPVALWRHFPVDDQSPDSLARAIISFQRDFDFDFIKVTPSSSFCLKDWGIEDEWLGATEGTREYKKRVIITPGDWNKLSILDPYSGYLGKQIECLKILKKEFGSYEPYIQTIFNPLSQAKNLVGGKQLLVHLRKYPEALKEGLEIITESTIKFVDAIRDSGVAGVFYAIQHASYSLLTMDEYELFGREYDLKILGAAQDYWLNVLHLHGEDIMFDRFMDYPIQVINWHDRETTPKLREGAFKFSGIVCGGLSREKTLALGTPDVVIAEAESAIASMNGKPLILGTGCVLPIITPLANIRAARESVDR